MTIKIDLSDTKNNQYNDMYVAIVCCDDVLLESDLDKNLNLDVILKTEEGEEYTPISLAVSFGNENAVRVLCTKMKAQGILTHHLSREILDFSPLHVASFRGNPTITKVLLANGADPNVFSGTKNDARGETPLMSTIRHISTYSLIEHGSWGSKELQEQLRLWYFGNRQPGQIQRPTFPKTAETVNWFGNKQLIQELLKKKGIDAVDPTAEDKYGISPYKLLTTLTDPGHIKRNTFHDGTSHPKVLSVSDDIIVFEAQIANRRGEKQTIKVTYDVRGIREMLAKKIKENELENSALSAKESKEDKEQTERKKAIENFSKLPSLKGFFTEFTKNLNSEISVVLNILTSKVDRAHYTKVDKIGDGIGLVSELPIVGAFVGGAPKGVGKGIVLANDLREKGKHKHLRKNVPVPAMIPTFCENIAINILEKCGPFISQLDAKKVEKMVEKTVEAAYETLVSQDIPGDTNEITQFIVKAVVNNKEVVKKLQEFFNEQLKENAKQVAANSKPAANGATILTQYSSKAAAPAQKPGAVGTDVSVATIKRISKPAAVSC